MGRSKNTPAAPPELLPVAPAHTARVEAGQVARQEQDGRVAALATKLNYNGSTDPAALENSAKNAIRRIGMGIFELGAYLLLLKEACEYGKFLPALERMGIEPRAAQRYMNVTRRFAANTKSTSYLERAGVEKLVELLPLDDEQLEDLTELGQTGELALDDVTLLSVKELRAKVRGLRAEKEADGKVLAKKQERIEKLEREKLLIQRLPPGRQADKLKEEASAIAVDALARVRGDLRGALAKMCDDAGDNTLFAAGLVGQLAAELAALRGEFNLPDVSAAADQELLADVAKWAPGGKGNPPPIAHAWPSLANAGKAAPSGKSAN